MSNLILAPEQAIPLTLNGHHSEERSLPKNYLTPLGEKIFLDRYAWKDGSKKSLAVGDTIIVCVDQKTRQREIGIVEQLDREADEVVVRLRDDTLQTVSIDHIDKPLETKPAQTMARIAKGIAKVEPEEQQAEWEERFRWLLEDWKFVPGGRIWAGAGTDQNLTYYNCYVVPSPHDSRGGIVNTLSQMTEIMSRGGGVGINISSLRPRYSYVKGVNGRSSGAVSWGGLYSFVTGLIEQGGSRRGALMLICNDWHPDILEFISSKRQMGKITNANISVGVSDGFMEAVKANGDWDLVYPDMNVEGYDEIWDGNLEKWRAAGHPVVKYKTIKARDMWNQIIESAWASAEPGLWFRERSNKMSNSWYFNPLISTNPCVTGDTLVAVADGRKAVPISKLAEEGQDVPVYCYAPGEGITISTGRNPRLTRQLCPVYRVTLDDGSTIRATPDHKFMLRDGNCVELQELQVGDRLMPFNKKQEGKGYWFVNNNQGNRTQEHRMMAEFIIGRELEPAPIEIVHHKDENPSNNYWDNLEIMSQSEHLSLHQSGDNNVMRDKWWNQLSEKEKDVYRQKMSEAVSGERNGMYGLQHSEETRHKIGLKSTERFQDEMWKEWFSQQIKEGMAKRTDKPWIYERTPEIRQKISAALTQPRVSTTCLHCGKTMIVTENRLNNEPVKGRICSKTCLNTHLTGMSSVERHKRAVSAYARSEEGRTARARAGQQKAFNLACRQAQWVLESVGKPVDCTKWDELRPKFRKATGSYHSIRTQKVVELFGEFDYVWEEAATFNHKVVSVEFDGYEDVYNITVDNYHNVAYITSVTADSLTGCVTPQCGEQPLPAFSVCNLGAVNLAKFVKEGELDWSTLGQTVRYAVRFLDDVISATPYFLEENAEQQLSERRVGLGVMGLAEMLIHLGLRYGSPEGNKFLDRLFRFFASEAYSASSDIAAEKGSFSHFDAEKFLQSGYMQKMPHAIREKVSQQGMRNVTLLTVAPTGTTGTMVNTSTGIEPYYFWSYYRQSRLGMHEEVVEVVRQWRETHPGEELPDHFVTAMDLAPEEHVRVQAAVQQWIDSSISKTCNVPNEYTIEQTAELYELMYELGCKGGTIYRDGSRSEQVLHLKEEDKKEEDKQESSAAEAEAPIESAAPMPEITISPNYTNRGKHKRTRPSRLKGSTYAIQSPVGKAYVTVNRNGNDQPFEVFSNVGKAGSEVMAMSEAIGRMISLMLRIPSHISPNERLEMVVEQLEDIGGARSVGFGPNRVKSLPDALAKVLRENIDEYREENAADLLSDMETAPLLTHVEAKAEVNGHANGYVNGAMSNADLCPTCGHASFVRIEGCQKCYSCGHSEC